MGLEVPPETPTGWVFGAFSTVSVTPTEVSVVCQTRFLPDGVKRGPGWCCLWGTFDFGVGGVLAT